VVIDPRNFELRAEKESKHSGEEVPKKRVPLELPKERPDLVQQEVKLDHDGRRKPVQLPAESPKMDTAKLDAALSEALKGRTATDAAPRLSDSFFQPEKKLPAVRAVRADSGGDGAGGNSERDVAIPGRQSVDEALEAGTGLDLKRPIAMPGGALFDFNSAELKESSIDQLRKLAEVLRRFTGSRFVVNGHTDSIGTPEYNLALSQKRAEAVRGWLVEIVGIEPARITTNGFGSQQPAVPITGDQVSEAANRRVEIQILPEK
jgi:outer membrane protein OmpA-like peptidoglycan-associated protein